MTLPLYRSNFSLSASRLIESNAWNVSKNIAKQTILWIMEQYSKLHNCRIYRFVASDCYEAIYSVLNNYRDGYCNIILLSFIFDSKNIWSDNWRNYFLIPYHRRWARIYQFWGHLENPFRKTFLQFERNFSFIIFFSSWYRLFKIILLCCFTSSEKRTFFRKKVWFKRIKGFNKINCGIHILPVCARKHRHYTSKNFLENGSSHLFILALIRIRMDRCDQKGKYQQQFIRRFRVCEYCNY